MQGPVYCCQSLNQGHLKDSKVQQTQTRDLTRNLVYSKFHSETGTLPRRRHSQIVVRFLYLSLHRTSEVNSQVIVCQRITPLPCRTN
jgi:hypothetical protein